jgi:hypothetical protein
MHALTRSTIIVAGVLASFAAIPASAQTTSCGWVLGRWTCESSQQENVFGGLQSPAVGNSVMDGFYRGQQMRIERERTDLERQRLVAEREAFEAARAAQPPAQPEQAVILQQPFVASLEQRQEIGEMLKVNRCTPAINRALELGDIQLATNIKAFCAGAEVSVGR